MKRLILTLVICLGCFGFLEAQNIWKPIDIPYEVDGQRLAAVASNGDMFAYGGYAGLLRSQDEGETWDYVLCTYDLLEGGVLIGQEGRIFDYPASDNFIYYSDDNGDTWQETTTRPTTYQSDAHPYPQGMYSPSNEILLYWGYDYEYSLCYLCYTLDGGDTWNTADMTFITGYSNISDVIANETGDVYVSVYSYYQPQDSTTLGVYHSTLFDMQHWELVAFEGIGVKDMEFDPEDNVICGVYFGGDFSGFEHVPGFYAFRTYSSICVSDDGVIYKLVPQGSNNALLVYSLDHGEHFYNTIQALPLYEPMPGIEPDGFLSKGHDNHLYFLGNGQYWKSIPNANDIPNMISFPSEWYYEIENENGSITYQHLEYASDTTVNHKDVKIIIRTNTLYDKDGHNVTTHEYVYEENGKVYWWNKTLEEFTVLYDFGAHEGDTWVTKVGTEILTMHVDAEEIIEYEGRFYRMLHVSDADDLFSGDIVCGIGHLTSFFPERLMDDGDGLRVEGLRCYWINEELVFKLGDEDCDAIYSEVHGLDEPAESQFNVYPNPTDGVITLSEFQKGEYRITNLTGQTVLTGNLTSENQQIGVSALPQGMYFITVGGATRKFVIR